MVILDARKGRGYLERTYLSGKMVARAQYRTVYRDIDGEVDERRMRDGRRIERQRMGEGEMEVGRGRESLGQVGKGKEVRYLEL